MYPNALNSTQYPEQLESLIKEIQKLLADNQLDYATKRVIDLAEEFALDEKFKGEAIIYQLITTILRLYGK